MRFPDGSRAPAMKHNSRFPYIRFRAPNFGAEHINAPAVPLPPEGIQPKVPGCEALAFIWTHRVSSFLGYVLSARKLVKQQRMVSPFLKKITAKSISQIWPFACELSRASLKKEKKPGPVASLSLVPELARSTSLPLPGRARFREGEQLCR